jgi:hypothetical protein
MVKESLKEDDKLFLFFWSEKDLPVDYLHGPRKSGISCSIIDQNEVRTLVSSMSRRCQAIINARGENTRY